MLHAIITKTHKLFTEIPTWFITLLARFSIAAIFWKSGQTKVQNFAVDLIDGRLMLGIPQFSDNTIYLFTEEYKLPLISPDIAAFFATFAEHFFPILILLGLATRVSALALLVMTIVIQIFVYPDAYAIHGVWAVVLLYLMKYGAGPISCDALITKYFSSPNRPRRMM